MNRPLLVSDCDEVLLHMVAHFRDWLTEAHGIDFAVEQENWGEALTRRGTGERVDLAEVWPFVDGFFDHAMARQTPVPGALDALEAIGAHADIVILTNLPDHRQTQRIDQLAAHGVAHRVICNQGGKGGALASLMAEMRPGVTVFVDDLAHQHESVARHVPAVWRLQMIAEPLVAAVRPPAPDAHARIDDWARATAWILGRFADGPAPVPAAPALTEPGAAA